MEMKMEEYAIIDDYLCIKMPGEVITSRRRNDSGVRGPAYLG